MDEKKGWESSFITGNYEKLFVSLDDFCLPSNEGIRHVRAWELVDCLKDRDISVNVAKSIAFVFAFSAYQGFRRYIFNLLGGGML